MCIAIPCQIIKFIDSEKKIALGDFLGVKREINIQLLEDVSLGDYVLVHVGYAIQKVNVEEALKSIESFNEISEPEFFLDF